MRTKIFILFFLLGAGKLTAQPYQPFPTGNATWKIAVFDDFFNYDYSFEYRMGGDTVINSITYKKISVDDTLYIGALREDSLKKILFLHRDSLNEELLYDFSATLGDTIYNVYSLAYGHYNLVVQSVDSLLIGPNYHRKINLGYCQWVEGIGSPCGLLEPAYAAPIDGGYALECFMVNGLQLFPYYGGPCSGIGIPEEKRNIEVKVVPQPFYDKAFIEIQNAALKNCTVEIYNMTGQRTKTLHSSDPYHIELDGKDFKAGLYFFKITSQEKEVAKGKILVGQRMDS